MSAQFTHSPGPWEVRLCGSINAVVAIESSSSGVIGGIYRGGDEDMLSPEDATLIAAAPEMLVALQRVLRDPFEPDKWRLDITQAIAKATG